MDKDRISYTICYTRDSASGQLMSLNKMGGGYYIEIAKGKEHIIKEFDNLNDAQARYIKLVNIFIHGAYDFNTRKEILLEV